MGMRHWFDNASRTPYWIAMHRVEFVPVPPLATEPDAFTPHGSEHALDRWADDGGRA